MEQSQWDNRHLSAPLQSGQEVLQLRHGMPSLTGGNGLVSTAGQASRRPSNETRARTATLVRLQRTTEKAAFGLKLDTADVSHLGPSAAISIPRVLRPP